MENGTDKAYKELFDHVMPTLSFEQQYIVMKALTYPNKEAIKHPLLQGWCNKNTANMARIALGDRK